LGNLDTLHKMLRAENEILSINRELKSDLTARDLKYQTKTQLLEKTIAKLSTENKILNQSLSTQHTRVTQIIEKKDSIQQQFDTLTLYKQNLESDIDLKDHERRQITLKKFFDRIDPLKSLRANFYKFCYLSDFHFKGKTIEGLQNHHNENISKIYTLESL
jgi:chromosome segregation ATPase